MKKILIMGLPGSGKTTLAQCLTDKISGVYEWFNADTIRDKFNDWDFSDEGRLRQASRMRDLADESTADYVICDFIAPLEQMRDLFNADIVIWMDTIITSRFPDTDKIFESPSKVDFHITEMNAESWSTVIAEALQGKDPIKNKYHIRFNHQHKDGFVWRVFENGTEHLVKHVKIKASLFDECTIEDGIKKWNVSCYGKMKIIENVAIIE